jgi:hypothetical protein
MNMAMVFFIIGLSLGLAMGLSIAKERKEKGEK